MPVDQAEIEELFIDTKSSATASSASAGTVKVVTQQKKTFFSSEENQKLGIAIPQLPKARTLKEAIQIFDTESVSASQIACLLRVWPTESLLSDLATENENMGPDEQWDKGESYMIDLVLPETIHDRLKVWHFKYQWEEEKEVIANFYKKIKEAYYQLETNEYFMQIIGYTLSIGNILNGGTPKGQADGFDLPVLGKLQSMKDSTNRTML